MQTKPHLGSSFLYFIFCFDFNFLIFIYFLNYFLKFLFITLFIFVFFQNDKRKEFTPKERGGKMTARALINTDISKISELEVRIMIIKILVGVEKTHRIPFCGDKRNKISSG